MRLSPLRAAVTASLHCRGGPVPEVCWKVIDRTPRALVVVLIDEPEDILARVVRYQQSQGENPTSAEKRHYLDAIKRDLASLTTDLHKRASTAHLIVDIAGCTADETVGKIRNAIAPRGVTSAAQVR
jgi:hypothetical protein